MFAYIKFWHEFFIPSGILKTILYIFVKIEYAKLPYIYVTIGDVKGTFDDVVDYTDWNQWGKVTNYNWTKMKKSIETDGIVNSLLIAKRHKVTQGSPSLDEFPWRCQDGNHRLAVLKYLYAPSYKIKAKIITTEFKENYSRLKNIYTGGLTKKES
jgi:hypothetical protein